MRNPVVLALGLATLSAACGDTAYRPVPPGPPGPRVLTTPVIAATATERPVDRIDPFETAGEPLLELTATAVPGHQPLPTYRATVRNLSRLPIRRALATVVYLDDKGLALPGENHDVAFGSPLKAIDPGVTLETSFLSRVDRAPGVRLVVRMVVFLEEGPRGDASPREWQNPRYAEELAAAEGRR